MNMEVFCQGNDFPCSKLRVWLEWTRPSTKLLYMVCLTPNSAAKASHAAIYLLLLLLDQYQSVKHYSSHQIALLAQNHSRARLRLSGSDDDDDDRKHYVCIRWVFLLSVTLIYSFLQDWWTQSCDIFTCSGTAASFNSFSCLRVYFPPLIPGTLWLDPPHRPKYFLVTWQHCAIHQTTYTYKLQFCL